MGDVADGALNAQSRVHGPTWAVFVRDGRTEQGHDPITRVLVDGAFETMHLSRNTLKAAVDEVVHDLGIELLGERGEAGHVGEQDGDLLALAFEGAARREDLLGQVLRGIGEWCLGLHRRGGCGGGRRQRGIARPDQHCPLFINGEPLALNEFGLQVLQIVVIDVELALEGSIRQAPAALQQGNRLVKEFLKGHR